jgi:PAS domain S-box-containing protein
MSDKLESSEHRSGEKMKNPSNSASRGRRVSNLSPVTIVLAASVLTISLLMGLGWQVWQSYLDHKGSQKQVFPIQALKGQIVHFDEVLTMSANMAAVTGDLQWEKRYRDFEPQLDVAIKSLRKLMPETFDTVAAIQTDEANIKLVEMENQVFELVGQERLDEARAIISSGDYCKQKKLYSSGMERIAADLENFITTDLESHRERAMVTLLSALLGLLLLALIWIWVLEKTRRYLKERNLAEKALKESEKKYRGFLEASPDAIAIFNEKHQIIMVNSKAEEMFGYSRQELLGKAIEELMPERFRDRHIEHMARFYADPVSRPMGIGIGAFALHKDGTEFPIDVSLGPLHTEEGLIVVADIRDITESQQAEEALKKSEERFRTLVGNIPGVVYRCQIEHPWTVEHISEGIFEIAGYHAKELLEGRIKGLGELTAAEDIEDVKRLTAEGIAERRPFELKYRIKHALGGFRWVHEKGQGIYDADGKPLWMDGVILDINEAKRAEEALRESKERLDLAMFVNNDGIFDWDIAKDEVFFDERYYTMAGYEPDEFPGTFDEWTRRVHPDDFAKVKQKLNAYLAGEISKYDQEFRFRRKDGQWMWIRARVKIIERSDSGAPLRMLGTHTDITDRKRAEERLRDSEKRSLAWLENSPTCMKIVDLDLNLQYMSRAGIDALKIDDVSELYGKPYPFYFYPESFRNAMSKNLQKAKETGEVITQEAPVVDVEGGELWFHSTIVPVKNDEGRIEYIIVVSTDTTERKRAEQQREGLLKTLAAKNEELQSIVYVASHDLKSPLVNIQGFSGELAIACEQIETVLHGDKMPAEMQQKLVTVLDEDIPQCLSFISSSTTKMQSLLQGLLEVSRVGTAAFNTAAINMNEMMDMIVTGMQFQITSGDVDVTVDDLPDCLGDTRRVNQVFTNIVNNAVNYLDPNRKGVIHISGKSEDGYSIYCVEDNGIGIALAHQPKIFELFHRLNPEDSVKGDGLGLTIVRRIIDRLGGKIWIESEPGKGSRFFISLPKA